MDFSRAFRDVEIKEIKKNIKELPDIASVSCHVEKTSAYVAVKGRKHDGHDFISDALKNGAQCIVCEKAVELPENITVVIVENSRKALAQIAANLYERPAEKLSVVGITGTNGKTTTSCMLRHILAENGIKCGLIGTVEASFGDGNGEYTGYTTPEAHILQSLLSKIEKNGCSHAVIEVSSQALDQDRTFAVPFELGVFLNLSVDHLDYHSNMRSYSDAKLKLFPASRHTLSSSDSDYSLPFISYKGTKTFSLYQKADFTAENICLSSNGINFDFIHDNICRKAFSSMNGMFNVQNALASLSSAVMLGVSAEDAVNALRSFRGVPGRMEKVDVNTDFDVIIDFAHTPDGIEKLLSAVRLQTKGRIITVFGCGGDRDASKRPSMGRAAQLGSDHVIVTSDNPRTEDPERIISQIIAGMKKEKYEVEPDRKKAIEKALVMAEKGDTVILAGKGHETTQEINGVKYPFDEREAVKNTVEKRNLSGN